MRNNLLLAVVFLASSSHAAVVVPSAVSGRVWVAPVAGVFSSVGTERIATMGSPALTALSTLDANAAYPFAASPRVLDLLAKNLQFYATPAGFASLPVEDKIIALRVAAKGAEIEASAIADEILAEAKSHPLPPSSADSLLRRLSQTETVALYLDAPRREEMARARGRLERFLSKWRKHVDRFYEELPAKIAAGAFDAGNVLVKTKYGWVAADESPFPVGDDLAKFYERRTEDLKKAPSGPWIRQEAALLSAALARPEVGGGKSWSGPAALALADVIATSLERTPALRGAAEAFERNARDGAPVAPRHILAVEKRYEEVLSPAWMPDPIRLRILASIRNGADGLPSWERLRKVESSTHARMRLIAMIAGGVIAAGIIVMIPLGLVGTWTVAGRFAALSLTWLAPTIVFVRGLWAAHELEWARDRSSVAETLRRTFRGS